MEAILLDTGSRFRRKSMQTFTDPEMTVETFARFLVTSTLLITRSGVMTTMLKVTVRI